MAVLNLNYYDGKDRYSDGSIENIILRIVRAGKTLADCEGMDFPVLYHLSQVRENILSAYPFRKGALALEIGAGPGAVTGVLCRKLEKVTSVELSRLRALINYERHKNYDNLEIMVGNLNDMVFDRKFDYVILNGVFEYAGLFTGGRDPWASFLDKCSSFLKDDGILLIAIENRLGLKYFSGAPEDHTGNYMEGLSGYPDNDKVRTFTKGEWTELLDRGGLKYRRFYYPFPDYKFPNEIFTDESLNADNYRRNYWNFNENRIELFPESRVASSLEREAVLDRFMNSFLIEAAREEFSEGEELSAGEKLFAGKKLSTGKKFLYAKINSDRAERFRIQTVISEKDGIREVEKSPLSEEAKDHLNKLFQNTKSTELEGAAGEKNAHYLRLDGKDYRIRHLTGELQDDGSVVYPYIDGVNLGAEAAKAARAADFDRIKEIFDALNAALLSMSVPGSGEYIKPYDGRFTEYFGKERCRKQYPVIENANIDLILDNIFLKDDMAYLIDAEWILDCPVEFSFILWRSVNELYACQPELKKLRLMEDFLSEYGISPEDERVFRSWTKHFENEYVGANRLRAWSKKMRAPDLKICRAETASLYIDRGNGFSEDDVQRESLFMKDGRFMVRFRIPDPSTVRGIRFDPVEGAVCICRAGSKDFRMRALNATAREEEGYLFMTRDPSFIVEVNGPVAEKITIRGYIKVLDDKEALDKAFLLLKGEESASKVKQAFQKIKRIKKV